MRARVSGAPKSDPMNDLPNRLPFQVALIKADDAEGLRAALAALSTDARADFFKRRRPLHFAASNGHNTVVDVLLAGGADVNARNNSGWSPLHSAAYNGHNTVVDVLLAGGADVNARSNS
ncbi:GA-binding protein subunit beta-1-like, partial [Penaeus chinensis]|uniref:GA-binding protein subunit beta-1-like n=1 Tax=Penaeus chinensis TaxID=139456 RepID=UPI001FB70A9D